MNTRTLRAIAYGASMAGIAVATGAQAQQKAPSDPTTSAAADAGADIIVTAQRRAERLDKVPIAASVVTGKELRERGINDITDLANQTPSLSIQNNGILNYINIRGVGLQATNPATSSGVAVYSDGFFVAHETAIGDPYYDVAQIEVLRGPQGTLVGQSSTGGAMFVNAMRPSTDRAKGYVQATAGNYDNYRAEGAINLPLSGTLAIRAAGHIDTKDGFTNNLASTSLEPGGMDGYAARIGIQWNPTPRLSVYIKNEVGERHGDGYAGKPYGEVTGTSLSSIGRPALRDPFTIDYNSPTSDQYHLYRVSAEINWEATDAFTVRSLTGFQRQRTRALYDQDYNSAASQTLDQSFHEYTIEQEINLISTSPGPFSWVIGGFFLRDSSPVGLINNIGPATITIDAHPVEHSYAAFAQVSYNLSPQWQIQLGGRYNVNRKTLTGSSTTQFPAAPFLNATTPINQQANSEEPTGKIALNYFPNDRTTLYISASRGFKAGGTNPVAPLVFAPEKINAYEFGFKTRPVGSLRLSGAAFYYDYKNMQLSLLSTDPFAAASGQAAITNAPKATIYGAELEASAQLGHLFLNASASYTHSRIDELTAIDARNTAAGAQDLTGRPLAYAPKWTFNVGATYVVPVSFGSLSARAQYAHTNEQYATPFELVSTSYSPLSGFAGVNDIFKARDLVDANITLKFNKGYSIELFGSNLTNEYYVAGTSAGFADIYGAPRQYGVRLRYEF